VDVNIGVILICIFSFIGLTPYAGVLRPFRAGADVNIGVILICIFSFIGLTPYAGVLRPFRAWEQLTIDDCQWTI